MSGKPSQSPYPFAAFFAAELEVQRHPWSPEKRQQQQIDGNGNGGGGADGGITVAQADHPLEVLSQLAPPPAASVCEAEIARIVDPKGRVAYVFV